MINYIYNQMFYLQELGILLGWCLTVRISGGNQTCQNHPLNSLKPLSKRILLNEFESSEGQNKILLFGKIV